MSSFIYVENVVKYLLIESSARTEQHRKNDSIQENMLKQIVKGDSCVVTFIRVTQNVLISFVCYKNIDTKANYTETRRSPNTVSYKLERSNIN